jgi:hypothetical protein
MEKIKSLFIFEVLGKPAEHIKQTLEEFIDKVQQVEGIEIISRKVHEPKLIEGKEVSDIFTTFAEVEMGIDNISLLFDVILNMLPSHVEVIYPDELIFKNFELSSVLSSLVMKIHKYDEVAKAVLIHENIFKKKMAEMQAKIDELEKSKPEKSSKTKDKSKKERAEKKKK